MTKSRLCDAIVKFEQYIPEEDISEFMDIVDEIEQLEVHRATDIVWNAHCTAMDMLDRCVCVNPEMLKDISGTNSNNIYLSHEPNRIDGVHLKICAVSSEESQQFINDLESDRFTKFYSLEEDSETYGIFELEVHHNYCEFAQRRLHVEIMASVLRRHNVDAWYTIGE